MGVWEYGSEVNKNCHLSTVICQLQKRLFQINETAFKKILTDYFLAAGLAAGALAAAGAAAPAGAAAAGAAAPATAVVSSCFRTRVNTMEATGILGEFSIS